MENNHAPGFRGTNIEIVTYVGIGRNPFNERRR